MFLNAIPPIKRKSPAQDDKRGDKEERLRRPREQVEFALDSCGVVLEQKGFRFDEGVGEMVIFWRIAFVGHEGGHRFDDIGVVGEKGWNDLLRRRGCRSAVSISA